MAVGALAGGMRRADGWPAKCAGTLRLMVIGIGLVIAAMFAFALVKRASTRLANPAPERLGDAPCASPSLPIMPPSR